MAPLERERERETWARTQAENSEKMQGSIFLPLFQFKVHRTNCEQIALLSSCRACEHVHLIYIYIYICMYVCMYVCMYIYVYIYIYI